MFRVLKFFCLWVWRNFKTTNWPKKPAWVSTGVSRCSHETIKWNEKKHVNKKVRKMGWTRKWANECVEWEIKADEEELKQKNRTWIWQELHSLSGGSWRQWTLIMEFYDSSVSHRVSCCIVLSSERREKAKKVETSDNSHLVYSDSASSEPHHLWNEII